MDYRRLGRTEMHVSALGLGTWQLGGEWGRQFTQQDVDRLFRRAQELGINLVDTAECYGDHLAESLIGRAISRNRKDWIVATKFGHRFHSERMIDERWSPGSVRSDHWSPGEVLEQLDRSLQALRTDYIDLYLFHSGGDEVFDNDELWAALNDQVRKGSIRFLGVALGASDNLHQTARATTVGASVIELTYNRLNRAAEAAVFESCHEQNLGVLAREPLANGFLSGKYRPGAGIAASNDWRANIDPHELQDRLDAVDKIRAEEVPDGVSMAEWAVAWCLRNPIVSAVIGGTKSVEQLESLAKAVDLPGEQDSGKTR
jgi:aryl-alcohol dehydrogenase-like predicted oxidoreductase